MQSSCDYRLARAWRRVRALSFLGAACCASACGSEADEQHEHGACAEIEEACAAKDDGAPGPIADCHQLAHEGSAEGCAAERAACLQACQ
jgi:hypothetical protein